MQTSSTSEAHQRNMIARSVRPRRSLVMFDNIRLDKAVAPGASVARPGNMLLLFF